jgi:hypothetical protein
MAKSQKYSLRKAINLKCRECTYDPLDVGGASHQIAVCTVTLCPLHPVRPITCGKIPKRLLDHWRITPADLCDRARPLVVDEDDATLSVEGQDGHPQETKPETHTWARGDA